MSENEQEQKENQTTDQERIIKRSLTSEEVIERLKDVAEKINDPVCIIESFAYNPVYEAREIYIKRLYAIASGFGNQELFCRLESEYLETLLLFERLIRELFALRELYFAEKLLRLYISESREQTYMRALNLALEFKYEDGIVPVIYGGITNENENNKESEGLYIDDFEFSKKYNRFVMDLDELLPGLTEIIGGHLNGIHTAYNAACVPDYCKLLSDFDQQMLQILTALSEFDQRFLPQVSALVKLVKAQLKEQGSANSAEGKHIEFHRAQDLAALQTVEKFLKMEKEKAEAVAKVIFPETPTETPPEAEPQS